MKFYSTREEWFIDNGFNDKGETWLVVGQNTFSIKDYLKEQDCKFNNALKWHTSTPIAVPNGIMLIPFEFSELYVWNDTINKPYLKEDADSKILAKTKAAIKPFKSNYIGEIGDRLRDLKVTIENKYSFEGSFGLTTCFSFKMDNDVIIWYTSSAKYSLLNIGQEVLLTGTVKALSETVLGEKRTVLTRCIIK